MRRIFESEPSPYIELTSALNGLSFKLKWRKLSSLPISDGKSTILLSFKISARNSVRSPIVDGRE
ncbi:unnamed protein product [Schistosoma curassoni]|uniref:Uncharacterized protein n=1 Tax=Schistosoma curassoni TaxID=6186 RepID=A0A183KRF3_9TREM|nr:unnamed protein product [Schistosoma curassoni]